MYTASTIPNEYMAGYSSIPLKVYSSAYTVHNSYEYVCNIAFYPATISSTESVSIGPNTLTKITFTAAHEFKVGDSLLLSDNDDYYSGYYIVKSLPSTTSAIINLSVGQPLTGGTVYRVIKKALPPDLQGEGKFDIANTIKDFVTQNLEDVNEIFSGNNTHFEYNILAGYESNYVFEFEDNGFVSGGKVSFWNSSLPSTYTATTLPFRVGDQVVIEQDLFEWEYTDNFFYSGQLGFTSLTNQHSFKTGQTVNVTGQITAPSYNGYSTVRTVIDNYAFTVYKQHNQSTPVEGGSIFGHPRPTYNTTGVITDIYWHATYGVVIETDIAWAGSSVALPGSMRLINDEKTLVTDEETIMNLNAYNARIDTLNYGYSTTQFVPYVMDLSGPQSGNNISTILNQSRRWRIEQSTKSWLLFHLTSDNLECGASFKFYNKAGTLLNQYYLSNESLNLEDFYVPVGIDQLIGSSNLTYTGSSLSTILPNVDYYTIEASDNRADFSNALTFELNDDCSAYDILHLMWKDSYGSWLSYPFKYISEDMMETEKKDYYQTEGNWTNNTFGYDTFGRGQKTFFARSRDKYRLNSGWVDETENFLIKDLMRSAHTYLQLADGTLIACNITNRDIKFPKKQSDYLWNYTFEVTASINENRF